VGLGLQWTRRRGRKGRKRRKRRKGRKRRKRRMVMRTKNAFAKDCASSEAGILSKQISVDKEIAALEVLDQKGSLATLVWILTWMEQVTWMEQASHSKLSHREELERRTRIPAQWMLTRMK
jgi:hypothetical protein